MKSIQKTTLSFACILCLQTLSLKAETKLEPIIVSASKTENILEDVSSAVKIISEEEIKQKGATRLRDVLKFSAGIYNIQPDKISIRGLAGRHTLILIDGKRLTGEVGSGVEIDRIDVSNIDRIEIIKGSASTLYGTDALGGIVNVITKKSDKPSTTISSQYGAHNTGDGARKSISFSSNIPLSNKLTTSLYGSYRSIDRLDDSNKESIQEDGSISSIGLSLSYKINQSNDIDFSADYMKGNGDEFINNDIIKYDNEYDRQNYSLAWKHSDDKFTSNIRAYTSIYDKTFEVLNTKKNKLKFFNNVDRETSVLEAQIDFFFLENHIFTAGGEYRREIFDANILNTKKKGKSGVYKGLMFQNSIVEIDYYALFMQDQWEISDQILLTSAIRYDDSDDFANDISPKLGLTYTVFDEKNLGLRFKANYSHGFKTPTPNELYKDRIVKASKKIVIQGNHNLISEKSKTFDLSLEGEYNNLSMKISYFHSDVEDLIEKVFTGKRDPENKYKIFSYENISESRMDGLELEAFYKINDSIDISANYTFLDTKGDIAVGPPPKKMFKTMQLENRPEHMANFKIHYNHAAWDVQVNVWGEYIGNMLLNYKRDKKRNIVGKNEESYTLLYASVTKGIGDNLEVYAGVDNITDKINDDLPLLGMFSYIGMRYAF